MNSRRRFLVTAPTALAAFAAACRTDREANPSQVPAGGAPGAPPTFGTAAGAGPAITPATIAEAEKLAQVDFTPAQRQQLADSWRQSMAPYLERRTGPRKVALGASDTPATLWNPAIPGVEPPPRHDRKS